MRQRRVYPKLISMFLVFTVLFGMTPNVLWMMQPIRTEATCLSGIKNNGLGGISININADPFTTFANYSYGQYAYGSQGCAWFASARVNQLTGQGNVIRSGTNWWNNNPYGWEKGGTDVVKAPAIVCWSGHVAIIEKIEGDTAYLSEGGSGWSDSSHGYCVIRQISKSSIASQNSGYLGCIYLPNATPSSYNPQGCVDSIRGNKGSVSVSGWAFDRDAVGTSIDIHVYAGDDFIGGGNANTYRSDVNQAYGTGDYHGFELTFNTNKTGNQHIKVFAINIGGGGNVLLGEADVNIQPADTKAPVFEYYKIIAQDSNRYVVECKVSDESGIAKVMCPTWTDKNSQDDLAPNWNVNDAVKAIDCGNGVYRFTVVVSDHNNEHGLYITHIYAFDTYGNSTSVEVSTILDRAIMPKIVKTYNNSIYSVYDEGISWHQATQYADSMSSNLVFIDDSDENDFVYNMIKGRYHYGYYIGACSFQGNPFDFFWAKYKGKTDNSFEYYKIPMKYSNWLPGEPNNTNGVEFYAIMPVNRQGKWNDTGTAGGINLDSGFVIETSLNIEPTSTYETDTKRYEFYNVSMPYTVAEEFCKDKGGHLATITSKAENNIIFANMPSKDWDYYIGASDIEKEGDFKWVTGEKFSYTNWAAGEPNNLNVDTAENYITIQGNGKWNDLIGQFNNVGFIAEFDKTPASSEPSEIPSAPPSVSPSTSPSAPPSVSPSTSPSVPPSEIPSETPNKDTIKGDVNMDKKVDLSDAQLTLKVALKISNLEANQIQVADVDGNGKIELADAQKILKAALKIEAL